jgi:predicted transcriptional regulator
MPPKVMTPIQETQALALLAEGKTKTEVADLFGVSINVISRLSRVEENSQLIAKLRESTRVRTLKRARKLNPLLADLAQEHAESIAGKPKTVQGATILDALSRAALNMEKVSSSASGEALKLLGQTGGVLIQIAPWAAAQPQQATATVLESKP